MTKRPDSERLVRLDVNGKTRRLKCEVRLTLVDALREKFDLTGTKRGCNEGTCGSCTVLLDGIPVYSCMTLLADCENRHVQTIEGIAPPNSPHPIQNAFSKFGGSQCGYCTPGMILSTKALLDSNPSPTVEEIKFALAGNLCRCTGYTKIVQAVLMAADVMRSSPGISSKATYAVTP